MKHCHILTILIGLLLVMVLATFQIILPSTQRWVVEKVIKYFFYQLISAIFLQLFPKPLLTTDQLKLLKYDNIVSGKYKTNSDIGVPATKFFYDEVKRYSHMWREGGQFSTEKYNINDNINN